MKSNLPARPNLEHLKGQAKTLLVAIQNREQSATEAAQEFHPNHQLDEPKLADAQLIVARQNGFDSWPKLVHHIEILRKMEGTWGFKSLVVGGNQIPAAMIGSSKIVMNGDRFYTHSPEGDYLGEFRIDVQRTPMLLDIHFIEGPHSGEVAFGIFELDGDQLTICLGLVGASRPTEFISKQGTMHALEILERVTKDAPVTVAKPVDSSPKESAAEEPIDVTGFDVMTPDLVRLQGEWIPVQLTLDGSPMDKKFLSFGKLVRKGNHTLVTFGSPIIDAQTRTHDGNQIDYLLNTGPTKGRIQLGIYEIDGDQIRVCMGAVGDPRPTEFESQPGSGRTHSVWKRK
jgi:uncharacterized protein (TIGR03067 family)